MAPLSTLRTSLSTMQKSGAPVTSASWLVWVTAASIMTPIFLLTRAVEPNPTWWSVIALTIGAAVSTFSGYHAGRWLEARGAGRPNDGGAIDLGSVPEATYLATLGTALAWSRTWVQVAPSWAQTASVVLVWLVGVAWLAMHRRQRAATGRRGSRDAVR